MEPKETHHPMLAKDAERGTGTGTSTRWPRVRPPDEPELPSGIDAEAAAERILALLEKDLYLPARDLAAEAIERFPEHPRLKTLWRVFNNRGKSWIAPGGPEPGRSEEFEWLRHPPESARGKWVALVGSEAVAIGDTLKEVADSVRSQKLSRRPLMHRID